MQVKLLRVLDSVAYYRLGGVKKVSVDVRVVAATNQDLEQAVAEGRFRGDLYHRLAQFTLRVPPLRERVADIAPLARHFLAQQDPRLSLSPSAIALLEAQPWPGNIREVAQRGHQSGGAGVARGNLRGRSLRSRFLRTIPCESAVASNLESTGEARDSGRAQRQRRPSAAGCGAIGNLAPDSQPETEAVSSGSDGGAGMSLSVAEKRREARHPGQGSVLVRSENPGSRDIQGKLVDVSASGFRMAHEWTHCGGLTARAL